MLLTFEQNKFRLRFANAPEKILHIKDAARFQKHADSKAEFILKRHLLKASPLPAGGLLFPREQSLLPFQRECGIPFILKQNRTYLAHQPGLGKSAQSIVAVNSKPGRTLIVVPSFLKTTWAREISKWSEPAFPFVQVVPESAKQFEFDFSAADFLICSDAMLAKEWVMHGLSRTKFKFIFIDEAHRFKNPESSRSVALFGGKIKTKKKEIISKGLVYEAEHVCALSGTPMLNRPIELWPLLFALAPETIDFMRFRDFGFRYGGGFQDERGHWHFTGSNNEAELRERIMGRFIQRIRKEDVLEDLPDKVRQVVLMTGTDPRPEDVREFDHKLSNRLENKNFEPPESLGEYAVLRHQNGLAKVPWVASMVREIMEADETESVILFAHHRDVVESLSNYLALYAPIVINGGVSQTKRTLFEDLFQSGRRRLIIGNIDAMNLGLTLTRATRVIFAEYAWTPALNEQAEDRAHRIGQKDSVFVQYVVLPNSLDEHVLNALLKKQDYIKKVIG